jgi:hypothetical protein
VDYEDGSKTYQGCDVGLRVGGTVEAVGYQDREAAEHAVVGWVVGEVRAVRVIVRQGETGGRKWTLYSADVPRVQSAASFAAPAG